MPAPPTASGTWARGQGDWADSLLELDSDFAVLLGLLDELGIASETLVIFAGDNGPEDVLLWRGTPGYWEGSYFAGGEGNLRTPCIARWPGHIPPGRTSDDIMHVTDWFTTLVAATGASLPQDRVIDGVNQLDWLTGNAAESSREGYLYWMGPELYGAKWRNFKLALVTQKYLSDPPARLATPRLTNLISDPQERETYPPALPAHLDSHPPQQAHRSVPGQRPTRATHPNGGSSRSRPDFAHLTQGNSPPVRNDRPEPRQQGLSSREGPRPPPRSDHHGYVLGRWGTTQRGC